MTKQLILTLGQFVAVACIANDSQAVTESKRIVSQYKNTFTKPPGRVPSKYCVDGPIYGNGDIGVAMGGKPDELTFYLHKNDMWYLKHCYGTGSPVSAGCLSLKIPGLKDASYDISQSLYDATLQGKFSGKNADLSLKSYVAASENIMVIQLTAKRKPLDIVAKLSVSTGKGAIVNIGGDAGNYWASRSFSKDVDIPSGCAMAMRLDNAGTINQLDNNNATATTDKKKRVGCAFTLMPSKPVTLLVTMDSIFKNADYVQSARKHLAGIDATRLAGIRSAHDAWWADFWAKSYVSINDPLIESKYYRSLYVMASCSRDPDFPPGLYGWVTTDSPAWSGDYHLNYNYQAPFYGLARANRLEQLNPHDQPILDFMERAKWHCKQIYGFEGVMYPVGIGPKGIEATYAARKYMGRTPPRTQNKGLFHGQRTNASYALVNMAPRWYTTYDREYGKKIYPFVRQVASFWENYVIWTLLKRGLSLRRMPYMRVLVTT